MKTDKLFVNLNNIKSIHYDSTTNEYMVLFIGATFSISYKLNPLVCAPVWGHPNWVNMNMPI
jgi:hypothetical protein